MMRNQVPHNRFKLSLASVFWKRIANLHDLGQLECLRPKTPPPLCRVMITKTI